MDIVKLGVNLNAQVRAACRSAFWSLLSLLRPSRSGYRTPQCCLTAIKENEENSGVYMNFFFFLNGARQKKKKGEPLLEQQTLSGTLWESLQFPHWPAGAAVDCEVQHGRHLEETPISALGW